VPAVAIRPLLLDLVEAARLVAGAGMEATRPTPLIEFGRYTGELTNSSDADVAVVDAPALLAGIVMAAAGELGQGLRS
jgi:hypothetical protein